ncbi:hypothetical protein GMSM_31760 [Geomonas sp. Red276]
MRFTINLATRRYLDLRSLDVALVLGFLVFGVLLVVRVAEVGSNQGELSRLRSVAARTGPTAPAGVSEAQVKVVTAKVSLANSLIRQKTIDWLGLLDTLEAVVPSGVALGQIQPGKVLGISGVAKGYPELQHFLENMQRSKSFSDVYLLNQNETKVGVTQSGLSFNLTCKVTY